MNYRPIRSNLVVKIVKEEKIGSIVLVQNSKENMAKEEGIILAMGEDMFPDSLASNRPKLEVGDKVAFARYGGKQLGVDKEGNELRVMKDIDILVVIEEE